MIKSVGGMKQIIDTYNAEDWVKSADISTHNKTNLRPEMPEVGTGSAQPVQQKTFGDFLFDAISKVNDLQKDANTAVEKSATGQSGNLHETMIMVEQAEIAFKTMNQIRMKVLDAYKEIMRIQI